MSIIKLKRSDTAAVSPTGLAHGEVAVNITDKKIFIGNSTGGTVLLVDGNATGGGGTTSTETIQDAAASLFTTGTHTGISVSYPDTNNSINLVNTGVLSIGGSTGVITAATGRTSLGLDIGTNVQAYNSTLAAVAGGTYTGTNTITTLGTIGTGTWQGTAIGDTYISSATTWNTASTDRFKWDGGATGLVAATGRTSLGLAIGSDVQGYNVTLAAVSAGTYTGTNTITTLGTIGTGTWNGTTIGAIYGGTGQTTYATGDLIYSSATDTLSKLTKPAATTSFLQMTSAGVPSWQTTIPATAGGTGSTAAFTNNALVYASSTSVLTTGTVFGITSNTSTNSVKITSGASPKGSQYFSVTESLLGSSAYLGLGTDATPGVPATSSGAYLQLNSAETTSSIYMVNSATANDCTISAGGSGEAFSITVGAYEAYGALVGVIKVVDTASPSPYTIFGDDGSVSGNSEVSITMYSSFSTGEQMIITTPTLSIVTTTPAVGKVLTCMDGSGTVSWETPSSARGWFL